MGSYAAAIFNVAVCFGIPLGALVFYLARNRHCAALFGLGVLSFVVSQVILRSAMLGALNGTATFPVFAATHPLFYAFFLAATAALFEETARLLFLWPQRKRAFDTRVAAAFGLGHGGIEAMIIGLNSAFLLISPMNMALMDASIALSGIERISTLMVHVALSALVYTTVMRSNVWPFFIALTLHTVVDLLAFAPRYLAMPAWTFEVILFLIAFVMLLIVLKWTHAQGYPEQAAPLPPANMNAM